MEPTQPLPRDLPALTSLRAAAALLVFGYHVGKDTGWLGARAVETRYGFVGVAFFFVLSGFVLTWSTAPGTPARDFWAKRVARVYPSHLFMAGVALVVPVLVLPVTVWGVVANLTLTQAWFRPWDIAFSLDSVSWSLSCEAFFYLIAPVVMLALRRRSTRAAIRFCAVWVGLSAVVAVVMGRAGNAWDIWAYTLPPVRSGEFVLGCLLALLVQRGWRPRLPLWLVLVVAVGVGLVLAGSSVELPQSVADVGFTPLFAVVILAAALADVRRPAGGWLAVRWLVYAGQVSFAFYLVHELVIINLLPFAPTSPGSVTGALLAVAALVVAGTAAVALHHGVELPAQRWVLRTYRARTTTAGASQPLPARPVAGVGEGERSDG